jgi:D-amino-acid dehydrogenase
MLYIMRDEGSHVVVVGGGAIGLGLAYELCRAGADVTLLEQGHVGSGASLGNAGWISPALCAIPVPGPGVVGQALRWSLRPNSPFLLRPRLDASFLRWLWAFRRACAAARFEAGLRALAQLNVGATLALERWQAQGVHFEQHRNGIVFAARTEPAFAHEHALYARLRELGFPIELEVLDGDALRRREPALAAGVVAGMVSSDEWHIRPESLTAGLADAFRRAGGTIKEHVRAAAIRRDGSSWLVSTNVDDVRTKRVVVATGASAAALMRPLGYRLPLEAAKGYSLTSVGEGTRPTHSIYLLEAKVACSPYANDVRLAGTLELAGLDLSLNRRRLDAVASAAASYLRWRPTEPRLEWAGLRPFAPDGLPVVGAVPDHPGLFVSTGHGMSGITLAAVSARLLAEEIVHERTPPQLLPFSPARFARR